MTSESEIVAALEHLSDAELEQLRHAISEMLVHRAIDAEDPEALLHEGFRKGFSPSGDPLSPRHLVGGIVLLTGMVRDLSSTRHRCSLYTVRQSEDEGEMWFWDAGCPSYISSDSVKAESLRRTVALHRLPVGAIVTQHTMVKKGDDRHERKGVRAYVVDHVVGDDGEVSDVVLTSLPDAVVRRLPPPPEQGGY